MGLAEIEIDDRDDNSAGVSETNVCGPYMGLT